MNTDPIALLCCWDSPSKMMTNVAVGLERLGFRIERASRGQNKADIVTRIQRGGVTLLVTQQRFYGSDRRVTNAIAEHDVHTVFLDFGFTQHYQSVVLDPDGENATSRLRREIPGMPLIDHGLKPKPTGPRGTAPSPVRPVGNGPFVFIPLQRPRDMVVRVDSSVRDMGRLVQAVLDITPPQIPVIVKPHPHDRNMPIRAKGQNLHICRMGFSPRNEQINEWLLAHAAVIVGINSNMLYRAIEYNKAIIAVGTGWFSDANVVTTVNGIDGLSELSTLYVDQPERYIPDWLYRQRYLHATLQRQILIDDLTKPECLAPVLRRCGLGHVIPDYQPA